MALLPNQSVNPTSTSQIDVGGSLATNPQFGLLGPHTQPAQPNNPSQLPPPNPTPTPTPTGGQNMPAGSNMAFGAAFGQLMGKAQNLQALQDQRNLLINHLYDQQLTPDQIAKLNPANQEAVMSQNRAMIEYAISSLNDQIKGRTDENTNALNYMLQGYQQDQAALQQKQAATQQVFSAMIQKDPGLLAAMSSEGQQAFANGQMPSQPDLLALANAYKESKKITSIRTGTDALGNPIYSMVQNGQVIGGSIGSPTTPSPTPQSAAAVNDPLGLKPGGQFQQFSNPQEGFQAGVDLVKSYQAGTGPVSSINGQTSLSDMVNTWITGSKTRTGGYSGANIAKYLNDAGVQAWDGKKQSTITANTPIGNIDTTALAGAIAKAETGYDYQAGAFAGAQSSTTSSTGKPLADPTMEQAAQDLAFGRTAPPTTAVGSRSPKTAAYINAIQQRAEKINPKFRPAQAAGEYKFATNQQNQQAIVTINTVEPNVDAIIGLSDAFKRSDYPAVNAGLRALGYNVGSKDITNLQELQNIISDELGKALAGNAALSDAKLTQAQHAVSIDQSPENFTSAMGILKNALENRKKALYDEAGIYASTLDPNYQSSGASASNSQDPLSIL